MIPRLIAALGAAMGFLLLLSAGSYAQTPVPSAPPALPATSASGAPALTTGSLYGYYLWIDGDTIHLRTTDPGGTPSTYTGSITTDGTVRDVGLIRAERDDWAIGSGGELDFHFVTANHVDGVHFTAQGASRLVFRLYRNGRLISTEHIYIGAGGVEPPGNPFVLFV